MRLMVRLVAGSGLVALLVACGAAPTPVPPTVAQVAPAQVDAEKPARDFVEILGKHHWDEAYAQLDEKMSTVMPPPDIERFWTKLSDGREWKGIERAAVLDRHQARVVVLFCLFGDDVEIVHVTIARTGRVSGLLQGNVADAAEVMGRPFVEALGTGDVDAIEKWFDPALRAKLTAPELRKLLGEIDGNLGAFQAVLEVKVERRGPFYAVARVRTRFARSAAIIAVTFDSHARVTSLLMLPPDASE